MARRAHVAGLFRNRLTCYNGEAGFETDARFVHRVDRKAVAALTRELSRVRNAVAVWAIARQWIVIAAAVAFVTGAGHWWAWPVAACVIATWQHALVVLMHEASHYHLLSNHRLNDVISDLFCAFPINITTRGYRHPRGAGGQESAARGVLVRQIRRGGRTHVLRPRHRGPVSACRDLRGQDPQERESRRAARRATDEVRAGDQPQGGAGARADHPGHAAAAGRSGDRVDHERSAHPRSMKMGPTGRRRRHLVPRVRIEYDVGALLPIGSHLSQVSTVSVMLACPIWRWT